MESRHLGGSTGTTGVSPVAATPGSQSFASRRLLLIHGRPKALADEFLDFVPKERRREYGRGDQNRMPSESSAISDVRKVSPRFNLNFVGLRFGMLRRLLRTACRWGRPPLSEL